MKGDQFVLTAIPNQDESTLDAEPIPDGRIAFGDGMIAQAWLAEPTLRYRHGVLGDLVEAEALKLRLNDGRILTHTLPKDSVFEDLEPRIVDLNGEEAVLVVRSYLSGGASIAVYRVVDGGIEPVGESDPIGLSFRWLNPIGAADFDGDGITEIAAVVTPHLSGRLTIYQRLGDRFVRESAKSGYSTHFIGSTVLNMSVVTDVDGDGTPDIVLPSLDRKHLAAVSFAGGQGRELGSIAQPSKIATSIVAADLDGDGTTELIFGRVNGALVVIRR